MPQCLAAVEVGEAFGRRRVKRRRGVIEQPAPAEVGREGLVLGVKAGLVGAEDDGPRGGEIGALAQPTPAWRLARYWLVNGALSAPAKAR